MFNQILTKKPRDFMKKKKHTHTKTLMRTNKNKNEKKNTLYIIEDSKSWMKHNYLYTYDKHNIFFEKYQILLKFSDNL